MAAGVVAMCTEYSRYIPKVVSFHDTTGGGQVDSEVWMVMSSYTPLSLGS